MEKAVGGVSAQLRRPLVVSGFLSLLSFADRLTACLAANETQAISFSPLSQARCLLLLPSSPPPTLGEIKQGKQTKQLPETSTASAACLSEAGPEPWD